jgi:uncharacterized membrane protein
MDIIVCKKKLKGNKDYIKGNLIRDSIYELIKSDNPDFTKNCYIRQEEVNRYRNIHLRKLIKQEKGNFDELDKEVINAISNRNVISDNIEDDLNEGLTYGQKVADKVADFGGSWTFISLFGIFIFLWMAINVWLLTKRPFDPYPFILLNLILSTLAAIQAPIIMMSQNRQEEKDRKRGENDYKVNLKAELEIKLLHEKLDHLILSQNKRLLEIQELQIDYLEDIIQQIGINKEEDAES